MSAEEEKIRAAVSCASARFAQQYAVVALPKDLLPPLEHTLNQYAMQLEVADDGEDDGMPALVVVPCSAAIAEHLRGLRSAARLAALLFLVFACLIPVLYALHAGDSWVTMAIIVAGVYAMRWIHDHRSLESARRMQATVRRKGF